jgi:N4-gp56 family major capsid protein
MSATEYGTNAPEAVKLWSRKLAREAYANTWFKKFCGESDNDVITIQEDLKKEAGDKLTTTLRMQLNGAGVVGDATLEGQEEALTTFTDSFEINQLRHAVRSKGKMTEKRIPWKHRAEAMQGLRDWWATRLDRWFFTQLCGYTGPEVTERGETYSGLDVRYTGLNPTIAPDSTAFFRADTNGSTHTFTAAAADQDITTTDTMRLQYIDELVAVAETRAPMIRPIMYQGEKVYVMILDTLQAKQLRTNTDSGQWQDIQKAAMNGGDVKENPIFSGALGMYNNVILHKSNRITQGVNASTGAAIATVRRAVFLGAQAGQMGFGDGSGLEKFSWHEELFDYGNQLGVKGGLIGGLKKCRYNSKDFGSLVFSTYAA